MNVQEIIVPPFPKEKIHESIVHIADAQTYKKRITNAMEMALSRYGTTHLVIYGDREHFANIHYFTGYDPRFEEAILILSQNKEPLILVGNEGLNYSEIIPYPIKKVLFQSLSLAGQPREKNRTVLGKTIEEAGIGKSSVVGIVGVKYYVAEEVEDYQHTIDIPHFIVKALETHGCQLLNVTDIMIHPGYGLRTCLDIDEMAVLELAATKTSRSVYNVMTNLKPEMSEIEASACFELDGDPLVAHPNLNFTLEGARRGLVSPGNHRLRYGSVFNIGLGYRSSMVARTALYARDAKDIPSEWSDIMEKIYKPYFHVIVHWYENIRIGATGKSILAHIREQVPEYDELGIGLNPGHLIHNDEWTSSIFTDTGEYTIKNGMSIQCDIIACPAKYPGIHIEDGLIMADADTRRQFSEKYPESWKRIQARRKLMKENLNIQINDEVLPLSDLQGCLSPWTVNPHSVLAVC
ncbi:MAG: hypothetical protein LBH42_00880 [Treponema sp.]|jgi:hypothetical protein|nr:hypothetical protein [Treponema sp.]